MRLATAAQQSLPGLTGSQITGTTDGPGSTVWEGWLMADGLMGPDGLMVVRWNKV